MLPKKYRLPAKEFRNVYNRGHKFRAQYGMLISAPSELPSRFGFVINKKIGNAVQRHRMTRLLRVSILELVNELHLDTYKGNFEYIAFVFCNSKEELKEELKMQLNSAVK